MTCLQLAVIGNVRTIMPSCLLSYSLKAGNKHPTNSTTVQHNLLIWLIEGLKNQIIMMYIYLLWTNMKVKNKLEATDSSVKIFDLNLGSISDSLFTMACSHIWKLIFKLAHKRGSPCPRILAMTIHNDANHIYKSFDWKIVTILSISTNSK